MSVVLVVPDRFSPGLPKPSAGGERTMPLALALSDSFTTDAHLAAYYPGHESPRRINNEALGTRDDVVMVAAIFDVDGHDAPDIGAWFETERPKIQRVRDATGCFAYRTRGGYRLVSLLPEPIAITSDYDAAAWSRLYKGWLRALALTFHVEADSQCVDWNRLFRVPHGTRDPGGQPEQHETLGDPRDVGRWTIPSAIEPPPAPAQSAPRYAASGNVERRAMAYLERMPESVSGAYGHDAAWRAAVVLVRGFALDPVVALRILEGFNERCEPPWSPRELEHKIASAQKQARVPLGYLVDRRAS